MVGKRGVWWWLGSVGWAVALLKKGGRLQEGEGGMGGGAAGETAEANRRGISEF